MIHVTECSLPAGLAVPAGGVAAAIAEPKVGPPRGAPPGVRRAVIDSLATLAWGLLARRGGLLAALGWATGTIAPWDHDLVAESAARTAALLFPRDP